MMKLVCKDARKFKNHTKGSCSLAVQRVIIFTSKLASLHGYICHGFHRNILIIIIFLYVSFNFDLHFLIILIV